MITLAADDFLSSRISNIIRSAYPSSPGRGRLAARAIFERRVIAMTDGQDPAENPDGFERARAIGYRAALSVPMMRGEAVIGVINVVRPEPIPFTESQIALLETFADQAVIAIENVRLFKELQEKNQALTQAHAQVSEALDQQTATAEILRIISQSRTDVQPVFDAIALSAMRLCGGDYASVFRVEGDQLVPMQTPMTPEHADFLRRQYPRPIDMTSVVGRSVIERRVVHVPDLADPSAPPRITEKTSDLIRRAQLTVPMLRNGEPVGVIAVSRRDPGAFSEPQIELLKTFAEQAVIAIENARLLAELQVRTHELTRSVEQLTALGDVGRAVSSSLDLETVLQTIVARANQLAGTAGCTIWEHDDSRGEFRLRASHYAAESDAAILGAAGRVTAIPRGQGVTTRVVEARRPIQISDITAEGAYESPIRPALIEAGHRALLGVPLLLEERVIGVLAVTSKTPGGFPSETVRLLSSVATQSALAIQNARLFREIDQKSRELAAASQHKSELLRTPLNAIIGFSEVLTDRMFGELNEKQEEYLKDIYASGTHLLSLINDILDLSKIEAGRMELELTDFDLPTALDNSLMLVRERAQRHNLTLYKEVDGSLGQVQGDERKIRQVVLNLLSNAVKFTTDGGRIEVRAMPKHGFVEVSVGDTGIGIAPEDQEKVFEEFRQVGTAAKKIEGTGLGLTLCRKFVELHGGKIWVKSQVGDGSTFTFTIPLHRGE